MKKKCKICGGGETIFGCLDISGSFITMDEYQQRWTNALNKNPPAISDGSDGYAVGSKVATKQIMDARHAATNTIRDSMVIRCTGCGDERWLR